MFERKMTFYRGCGRIPGSAHAEPDTFSGFRDTVFSTKMDQWTYFWIQMKGPVTNR